MTMKIPRLLLVGALLSPNALYALGLGEIHLHSALNQPFDADVELIAPTREELQSLKVGLASPDTFSRYGLDRPAFLSNLKFRVARTDDGRSVLKVTSNQLVTEPFVTFILEAGWSRGRLLREYTVLLDPPVYMPPGSESSAPVATPRSGAQSAGIIERPRSTSSGRPASAAAAPERAPVAFDGNSYTVQRNDTLWRIASRVRPGSPRVVNQTMIALFRANPQAFDDNINRLRSGAVLTIPDADAIAQVSQSEASHEVAEQNDAWRGTSGAGASNARLRLVTPEASGAPASRAGGEGTAPSSGNDAALRSQVDSLQSQLDDARRLLEVKNAELAEMQRRLDEAKAAAPAQPPQAVAAPEVEVPVEAPPPVAEPEQAAPPPKAVEPPPQPVKPVKPAVLPRAPEPTVLERLGDYWWALVVLGLAILAGLMLYFRKRREPDIEDAIDTLTPTEFGSRRGTATATTRPRGRRDEAFLVEEDKADKTSEIESPPTVVRTPAAVKATAASAAAITDTAHADTISSETAIAFDQQDALAEADFHMAYGLYDQAADLVRIAMEREPERRDLKLKLLEIFFVWGNKDQFLESARELASTRAQGEPGEWDKVLIMGKQICPEDPLFAEAVASDHTADIIDLNLEGGENRVDVDLFEGPADATREAAVDFDVGAEVAETRGRGTDDTGLDFLLDEPQRGGTDFGYEDDSLVRTQETPTVESETLAESDAEGDDRPPQRSSADQTAELAIDDLGLDVDAFAGADTAENLQLGEGAGEGDVDIDFGELEGEVTEAEEEEDLTAQWAGPDAEEADSSAEVSGGTLNIEAPDLRELEPVTMSEVGTKLDLARAYVDMGDPDGARSILEEVLTEGSSAQQQEAQRLLDSIT
jgi:pilus assembly protein FimV